MPLTDVSGRAQPKHFWSEKPSTSDVDGAYPLPMTAIRCVAACVAIGMAACGGSQKEAEEPSYSDAYEEPDYDEVDQSDVRPGVAEQEASESDETAPIPEPEFGDGMSVNDAINAVPQGVPRVNLDMDVLARPLAQASAYDSCKPSASQHFNLKVAVWDGRAVGVDVKTTPNNPSFAECIAQVVRNMKWDDNVKSLNTVEYSF